MTDAPFALGERDAASPSKSVDACCPLGKGRANRKNADLRRFLSFSAETVRVHDIGRHISGQLPKVTRDVVAMCLPLPASSNPFKEVDPVSSTAYDRCPYADHAAVNVMQQGVQSRPVAPKGRRPGLRLDVRTRQLCTPQNRLPQSRLTVRVG
jgi:hypothetical protein